MSELVVVRFIGTDNILNDLRSLNCADLKFINSEHDDVMVTIYETDTIEALFKVPKHFTMPTFFLLTKQDKAVEEKIKDYKISGLIFTPLDANVIVSKIKKAMNSTFNNNNDNKDIMRIKLLAKSENIPPLPSLALELINLTRTNDVIVKQVVEKIKQDQGITTKLIKLVNSPFYGIKQEISSIERSTVLLGFNTIKNIALALSLDSFFHKQFGLYNTTGKKMWEHSYRVASIAQALALHSNKELDLEALYLAGLMHDIGKVVMVDFLVKEVHSREDEREQLGFDHVEVSVDMLTRWGVNKSVTNAVSSHHNSFAEGMGRYIYYANLIDKSASIDDAINEAAIILALRDLDVLKNKIVQFVENFDE